MRTMGPLGIPAQGVRVAATITVEGVEEHADVESELCQREDGQSGREQLIVNIGWEIGVENTDDTIDRHEDQYDQVDCKQRSLQSTVLQQLDVFALAHPLQCGEQLVVEYCLAKDVVEPEDRSSSIAERPGDGKAFATCPLVNRSITELVLDDVDDDYGKKLDSAKADKEVVKPISLTECWKHGRAPKVGKVHGDGFGDQVGDIVDDIEPKGCAKGDGVESSGDQEEDAELVDELCDVDDGKEVVLGGCSSQEDHTREGMERKNHGCPDKQCSKECIESDGCGDQGCGAHVAEGV